MILSKFLIFISFHFLKIIYLKFSGNVVCNIKTNFLNNLKNNNFITQWKNVFFKLLIFLEKSINPSLPLCLIYINTNSLKFYREYKGSGNPRDQITSKISSHVQAIKKIYEKTDFEGIRGIGFLVSRLRVCELSIFIMLN